MDISGVWLLLQSSATNTEPTKTEQLIEWLTSNSMIGWGLAAFAVFAIVVAAIAKLTGNLDKIIGFFTKYRPKKQELTDEDYQRLRENLRRVVLGQVVERLEKSLHHKIRLDLKRKEENQRVGKRDLTPPNQPPTLIDNLIKRAFNPFDKQSSPTPVDDNVPTIELLERDDIRGRLLILGEPGAGKTNELLALARDLLKQATQSPDRPIPVIFELSEWSGGQDYPLADWLSEQLYNKHNVPLKVSQQWLKGNQIFPLLDGLDELRRVDDAENAVPEEIDTKRQARQIQCIRSINEFLDLYPDTSMVVCCRRKEYEVLEAQSEYLKRLNGAIYLQELDDAQIEIYLDSSNRGPLWESLKHQPSLLKLARSPLFLLMLLVAYQGQPIQSSDELLDFYIEQQLGDLNNQGAYSPRQKAPSKEETERYLGWLASKLEEQEVTEFLIERLQPSWLDRKLDKKLYELIVRLMFGLVFWLAFGLLVGLIDGLTIGLTQGLISGLLGGLVIGLFGLILGLIKNLNDIKSVETLFFSWKKMIDILGGGLTFGLTIGLMLVLSGLLEGQMIVLFGLSKGLIGGLITGLIFGLILGVIGGLIGGLTEGLIFSEAEIYDKQLPNQGIKGSAKMSLIFGLITWLIVWLIFGLIGWLSNEWGLNVEPINGLLSGLLFGLLFGLIFGLIGGLGAVLQHLSLRYVLYRSGVAPWNYEKFLEHAENHRFIQRVGGRYRFVHDLLRKRFAARYQTPWN